MRIPEPSEEWAFDGHTISSLIARLEYLKEKHGDLVVFLGVDCPSCGYASDQAFSVYHLDADKRPERVHISTS